MYDWLCIVNIQRLISENLKNLSLISKDSDLNEVQAGQVT